MILALDLSTKSSGWAVFDNNNLVSSGYITATSTDLVERITKITKELNEKVLKQYKIKEVIAEEVQPTGGYGVGNQKTHKALMWMQAAIAFLLHDNYRGTMFNFIYPSSWRSKCGIQTGRGITRETLKQRDITFVKNKFNKDVNDDEADAICIGYAYTLEHSNEINFI